MALQQYRRKRDFTRTKEPAGRERRSAGQLSFVVQKHAARRLHYDFRLELDGVLKSWAVPKGPSLDPGDKRLAVHVEDHPLEYGSFEGTIPEGEYGAGTVEIWDKGWWIPEGDPREGYRRGRLTFTLNGRKLRGRWNLVRMKGRSDDKRDNWLLMKADDNGDGGGAKTRRAAAPQRVASERTTPRKDSGGRRRAAAVRGARGKPAVDPKTLPGARAGPLPEFVEPQLATLVEDVPPGEAWIHEIKFDGYRLLCGINGDSVRMLTRHGKDWTERFEALGEAAHELPVRQALIDGEAVVVDEQGISSFQSLQEALSEGRGDEIIYFAFDLLYLNGSDLRDVPLVRRKEALASIVAGQSERIRYSDHIEGDGKEFFQRSCKMGLEGILSKPPDGVYESGRSRRWLKVKCQRTRQEFVIGGFTDPEGARSGFGALLLGVYDKSGQLVYVGKVGTGFSGKLLEDIHRRLRRLERKTSPFANYPGSPRGVHWVEPQLVAEVAFRNWTRDNVLRQAAFIGLREDKPASEVVREEPQAMPKTAAPKTAPAKRAASAPDAPDGIAGVRLTNPDRVLYPEQGLTKRDLALFYRDIAEWVLPHVIGRPLTLVRCPEGHRKQCFYQKHADDSTPAALKRIQIKEETGSGTYVYIDGLAGLITLVQMGTLEIHPWGSRVEDVEHPDRITIDLDPSAEVPWPQVVETTRWLHARFSKLGLESFLKTTGGKGLHVVVPLAPVHTWDQVKAFSKDIAEEVVHISPTHYTTNPLKSARKGKILVDYLRNSRGATAVAAYSTRARPGAPVSTPVAWSELSTRLRPDAFTVQNLARRLSKLKKDPWEGYLKARQRIPRVPA